MRKTVTIGAPIRDRGWILEEYLQAIYNLDYPKELISLKFILNDSIDDSDVKLSKFIRNACSVYGGRIKIIRANQKAPKDERISSTRDIIYRTLSRIRNLLISDIDTNYFFSVDTDIIVPSHALKNLVGAEKDIIAGIIWNDGFFNPNATYPDRIPNLLMRRADSIIHYKNHPQDRIFRVDITGAVYLMSKAVCDSVKYGYHKLGEDIYFCNMARDKKFEIWADPSVFCDHRMVKPE